MTTVCAVQMGDPASAVVAEYDDTFTAVATGSGETIATQNAAAMVTESDWSRDYDAEKYMLIETINGKSRQTCVARVELAPEEATFFFGKDYTVQVTGRVYDNWESDAFLELEAKSYTVTVPAADFEFKPLDVTITAPQYFANEAFTFKTSNYLGVSGYAEQKFEAGFKSNPYDETADDKLNFWFSLDAPTESIPDGSIVYQYVSYVKSGAYNSKVMTVGCATTVGDPYVAQIDTFNGTASMASNSTVVFNKTWDEQNNDERAQIKKSFKLGNEVAFYRKDYSFVDEVKNTYMPCVAEFTFDGKLAADNSLFGDYDMTIGVRVYADEFDTEPKSLPTSTFTVTIGEPESDLAAIYEEETTEETSALLESFKEKQRFKLSAVFPDEYDASTDADTMYWGYQ